MNCRIVVLSTKINLPMHLTMINDSAMEQGMYSV